MGAAFRLGRRRPVISASSPVPIGIALCGTHTQLDGRPRLAYCAVPGLEAGLLPAPPGLLPGPLDSPPRPAPLPLPLLRSKNAAPGPAARESLEVELKGPKPAEATHARVLDVRAMPSSHARLVRIYLATKHGTSKPTHVTRTTAPVCAGFARACSCGCVLPPSHPPPTPPRSSPLAVRAPGPDRPTSTSRAPQRRAGCLTEYSTLLFLNKIMYDVHSNKYLPPCCLFIDLLEHEGLELLVIDGPAAVEVHLRENLLRVFPAATD